MRDTEAVSESSCPKDKSMSCPKRMLYRLTAHALHSLLHVCLSHIVALRLDDTLDVISQQFVENTKIRRGRGSELPNLVSHVRCHAVNFVTNQRHPDWTRREKTKARVPARS